MADLNKQCLQQRIYNKYHIGVDAKYVSNYIILDNI